MILLAQARTTKLQVQSDVCKVTPTLFLPRVRLSLGDSQVRKVARPRSHRLQKEKQGYECRLPFSETCVLTSPGWRHGPRGKLGSAQETGPQPSLGHQTGNGPGALPSGRQQRSPWQTYCASSGLSNSVQQTLGPALIANYFSACLVFSASKSKRESEITVATAFRV